MDASILESGVRIHTTLHADLKRVSLLITTTKQAGHSVRLANRTLYAHVSSEEWRRRYEITNPPLAIRFIPNITEREAEARIGSIYSRFQLLALSDFAPIDSPCAQLFVNS